MNQTTVKPSAVASYTAADVKRMLATGDTVKQVAELTGWPRQSVTAVINGVRGWMLDPNTDKVYQPGNKHMAPTLPDGIDPARPPAAPVFREPNGTQPPAPALNLSTKPRPPAAAAEPGIVVRKPDRLMDAIAIALGLLDSYDDPTVAKDVQRARDALAKLRGTLAGTEERRAAEKAVVAAEQALLDAKERLRDLKTGKAPAAVKAAAVADPSGPTPREVRAWAAEQGLECSPNGKIPSHIRTAYDTAHNQEATTQ